MVHRRAYGYDPNSPSPVDFALADYSDTDAFLELVLYERGKETMAEGKRTKSRVFPSPSFAVVFPRVYRTW